jgi:hypothetical protein
LGWFKRGESFRKQKKEKKMRHGVFERRIERAGGPCSRKPHTLL